MRGASLAKEPDTSLGEVKCTVNNFKQCKIQPIINLLFILEPRGQPIEERWTFRRNSTCSCPLICRFGLATCVFCWKFWEVIKNFLTVTHQQYCWTSTNTHSMEYCSLQHPYSIDFCAQQDPLLQPAPLQLSRTHKTAMILWLLDRYWQRVSKMVITKIPSGRK